MQNEINLFRRSIELIYNTAKNMDKDEKTVKQAYQKVIQKDWHNAGIQPLYDFMNELEISIADFKKVNSNDLEILDFLGFGNENADNEKTGEDR